MKKFKKLYLHIGQEKTGTTSIQRAFDTHRDKLESLGFLYPKATAVGKNILLGAMFGSDRGDKPLFQAAIEKRGGTIESFTKAVQTELRTEYEGSKAKNLILSSEFIAAHTDLEKVKEYCDSIAEHTEVILYIREQSSLMMSLYSTFVKGGGITFGALSELSDKKIPDSFSYRKMLERITKVFPDNLTVRIFEREGLRAGNIINDFLEFLGIAEHEDDFQITRQNESLSIVGVEVLKAINIHMPIVVDGQKNMARTALIKDVTEIDAMRNFDKPALSSDEIKTIEKLCRADNKWVRDNYFKDRKSLFESAKTSKQSSLNKEDVLDHAAELITTAYTRLWERQALLNETAPMLKSMQNRVNRTMPKLNVIDNRISKTGPLVKSVQEKVAQARPLLEALNTSSEGGAKLAAGSKGEGLVLSAIKAKMDQANPMFNAIQNKIDQSNPLLDSAHQKIDQSLPMIASIKSKMDQSSPMLLSVREKIDQTAPLLKSANEKIAQTPDMITAIQEKLDQTLPMLNAIQEKINQTLPLIKNMQDKIDNAVPMLGAMQDKMENAAPTLDSVQTKLDDSIPMMQSVSEKVENAVPMLSAAKDKMGSTTDVLSSARAKVSDSIPMFDTMQSRLSNQGPTISALMTKLDNIGPLLDAIQDNIDHAVPSVGSIRENLDDTAPELNAMHARLSVHRKADKTEEE